MRKSVFINYKFLSLILVICICLLLIACKSPGSSDPSGNTDPKSGDGQGGNNQSDEDPVNITETNFKILTGTAYETTVYKFVTDKEGPKIAIVGGIHGDEIAGWTAALRLVDSIKKEKGICGEIIIVPEANIVAIDYDPGASEVNQLNRIKLMLSTAKKNLK